jgi:hypothetical protein
VFKNFLPTLNNFEIISVDGVLLANAASSRHVGPAILQSAVSLTVNITTLVRQYRRNETRLNLEFKTGKTECQRILSGGQFSPFQSYFKLLVTDIASPFSSVTLSSADPEFSKNFYVVNIHSPRPTSTPTTMPTCSVGWFAKDMNGKEYRGMGHELKLPPGCTMCPPGYITSLTDQVKCTPCPSGFFNDEYGASACKSCSVQYPYYSTHPGMSYCNGVFLNVQSKPSAFYSLVVIIFFTLLFAFSLAWRKFLQIVSHSKINTEYVY